MLQKYFKLMILPYLCVDAFFCHILLYLAKDYLGDP